MIPRAPRFAAGFNGSSIEVDCGSAPLADELGLLLGHLLIDDLSARTATLRLTLEQIESDWFEIRDSAGRCDHGQRDYVLHCARRWALDGLIEAHPGFLWLHAAAAALDDRAVLICGSPGAGKSTLAVQLLERGWSFVADDVVPVDVTGSLALPMPCAPCIRTGLSENGGDPAVFLQQSKRVVAVASGQVAATAQPIGAIVFPEFAPGDTPLLSPLSAALAASSLIAQCLRFDEGRTRTISSLFRLAEALPAFHLRYRDPAATAAELTRRWPEMPRT